MPCNAEYMNPTSKEREVSRVACLLDELMGLPFNQRNWEGYHPEVYGRAGVLNADAMVAKLCSLLQGKDVTKYSLEMQIWWRDHQQADKNRLECELAEEKTQRDREAVLAKLTPYERKLLGY